jgi:O-antigen ligase
VRGSDIEALDFSDKVASIKNDAAGSNRLWSTFSNPLTFSEYLVLSFPLAVYLLGYASKRWQRILGFIASTASIAILLYSHARSGLIATALVVASLVVVFGFKAIRQKRSLGFSLIGAFAIIILIFAIIGSVGVFVDMVVGRNAAESGSSMARIVMLERGSILTMASPILGYGPGRAALTLGFLPGITQLTIDNYYLSVALETGFPGLLLFLGMLGYLIFKGAVVGATNSGIDSARVIVLVSALSGFATIRSVLSLTHNFGVLFLLIALLVIALEVEKNSASGE